MSSLLQRFPCHRLDQSNKHPKEKREIGCGAPGTRGLQRIELYLNKAYFVEDDITQLLQLISHTTYLPKVVLPPTRWQNWWFDFFLSLHITSHQITSLPLTSKHITWHDTTPYHITVQHISSHYSLYHITLHPVTSHHIASRHVKSQKHNIISHHITSHQEASEIISSYNISFYIILLTQDSRNIHL